MNVLKSALVASAFALCAVAPTAVFAQLNTSTTVQTGGGDNAAGTVQSGDDNLSTTVQSGRNNAAVTGQAGCVNTAVTGQNSTRSGTAVTVQTGRNARPC